MDDTLTITEELEDAYRGLWLRKPKISLDVQRFSGWHQSIALLIGSESMEMIHLTEGGGAEGRHAIPEWGWALFDRKAYLVKLMSSEGADVRRQVSRKDLKALLKDPDLKAIIKAAREAMAGNGDATAVERMIKDHEDLLRYEAN